MIQCTWLQSWSPLKMTLITGGPQLYRNSKSGRCAGHIWPSENGVPWAQLSPTVNRAPRHWEWRKSPKHVTWALARTSQDFISKVYHISQVAGSLRKVRGLSNAMAFAGWFLTIAKVVHWWIPNKAPLRNQIYLAYVSSYHWKGLNWPGNQDHLFCHSSYNLLLKWLHKGKICHNMRNDNAENVWKWSTMIISWYPIYGKKRMASNPWRSVSMCQVCYVSSVRPASKGSTSKVCSSMSWT